MNIEILETIMREDKDISPFLEEPFEILKNSIDENGMKREKAEKILSENDYKKADIEHIIERLIANGHIYEVENTLYITPTE